MIQFRHTCVLNYQKWRKRAGVRADGVQKYQPGGRGSAVPHGMRRTGPRPKAGDKERPACGSRGLTDIRPCPARAPCAAYRRRRRAAAGGAPQAACHTGACLPDAGHRAAGRAAPDVRCPARRDGGRRRRAERRRLPDRPRRPMRARPIPLPSTRATAAPTSARKALSTRSSSQKQRSDIWRVGSPRTRIIRPCAPTRRIHFPKTPSARPRQTAQALRCCSPCTAIQTLIPLIPMAWNAIRSRRGAPITRIRCALRISLPINSARRAMPARQRGRALHLLCGRR